MLQELQGFVDSKKEEIIELLSVLVNQKGGSRNAAAIRTIGSLLNAAIAPLGFDLHRIPNDEFGDFLLFTNHQQSKAITLVGHMETTFTQYDHLPEFSIQGDRAVGPGTGDMLGGLVVFVYALKCIKYLGKLDQIPLTVFFNSDEERGAPASRAMLEELAHKSSYAIVSESAGPKGELVIGRRGKISFDLLTRGIEGHAGNLQGKKASAIEEMAHKILAIESLNSRWKDTDINAGKINGGIAGNTIAQNAQLACDIRYAYAEQESEIRKEIRNIVAYSHVPGCKSKFIITSQRPLWQNLPASTGQKHLVAVARQAVKDLGQVFGTEIRKGTSDANFFGCTQVPTLDGMGPIGFDDHSDKEYILINSLFERIKLCALLLLRLA